MNVQNVIAGIYSDKTNYICMIACNMYLDNLQMCSLWQITIWIFLVAFVHSKHLN